MTRNSEKKRLPPETQAILAKVWSLKPEYETLLDQFLKIQLPRDKISDYLFYNDNFTTVFKIPSLRNPAVIRCYRVECLFTNEARLLRCREVEGVSVSLRYSSQYGIAVALIREWEPKTRKES